MVSLLLAKDFTPNNKLNLYKMGKIKKTTFRILLFLSLLTFNGFGQNEIHNDSIRSKLMNAAKEIMVSAGNCALITLDSEGRSRVRVMDPFLPESDFTVWFGTNPKSRKVDQIKKDARVTLYYFDPKVSGYVMIYGKAELIDDPKEKEKQWKDEWDLFYPDKINGYLLIKVTPEWMEVISESHGIYGDKVTWKPPIVYFKN